jgi:hypothetical protein
MADYATLLRDHVTLTCRSVDRIFLQAYVPKLQTVGWVCQFLRWRRGFVIPSSAAFGKIGDEYVREVHRYAAANDIPVIHFSKGDNKEEIARPLIDAAAAQCGNGRVVLIGIAQEKAPVWRSWKAKGQEHAAHPHMEWGRQMAFVNHFYFYLWDPDWGGAFWKTNAYAPYPIWIWLNGHTWARRQCERAGIGYIALDNGFASCDDPAESFFWRWLRRLPSPFTTADLRAGYGYGYELAFRQFEVPTLGCSTGPAPDGRSSRASSATTSISAARRRWRSPSTGGSTAEPPARSAPRSLLRGWTRRSSATTRPAASSSTSIATRGRTP